MLFHHLKQILYTFFSFLHKWSSMVYIFILFQLILLKPIISNFRCLFFHGKKEKKETIKGIGQAFYLSILVRYINFQVHLFGHRKCVSPSFYYTNAINFFLISTLTVIVDIYFMSLKSILLKIITSIFQCLFF